MPDAPVPLSVEDGARRLEAVLVQLRALVHHHAGRLALEPRLEVKGVLAAHLYDDAQGVSALRRRLEELGRPAGEPLPEPIGAAYGAVKPALAAALREHLERLDPVADEPGLRLLTELAHRQERHVAELPAGGAGGAGPPTGGAESAPGALRPARDAFLTVAAATGDGQSLHARMHSAVWGAELAALTSHEHPAQPWALHADLARLAWDGMRHAAVLDRALTAHGRPWGSEPVDLAPFDAAYAQDLPGRLAALAAQAEAHAAQPPPGLPADAATYVQADAAFHAAVLARAMSTLSVAG